MCCWSRRGVGVKSLQIPCSFFVEVDWQCFCHRAPYLLCQLHCGELLSKRDARCVGENCLVAFVLAAGNLVTPLEDTAERGLVLLPCSSVDTAHQTHLIVLWDG